jgi:hypothetical protein
MAGVYGANSEGIGVWGKSSSPDSGTSAVYGENIGAGPGVHGSSINKAGVWGESNNDVGVFGFAPSNSGVLGHSTNKEGVKGESANDVGVYGKGKEGGYFTTNQHGTYDERNPGVNVSTAFNYNPGVSINTVGSNSDGVSINTVGSHSDGVSVNTSGNTAYGIRSRTYDLGSVAVSGWSNQSAGVIGESNDHYGVYGHTSRSDQKYGIYTPDYLYAKGTQVPAADVAEYMQVAENVTPGTVLVIGKGGVLRPSVTAYDTHVAGIVSTQPGVSLGTKEGGNPGEAQIAVAGKVPCNVDASNGPIEEGDLLTTSSRPGYAMKATDPKIGTVLGKAMGSLESGTGTIEVIVTLQ